MVFFFYPFSSYVGWNFFFHLPFRSFPPCPVEEKKTSSKEEKFSEKGISHFDRIFGSFSFH